MSERIYSAIGRFMAKEGKAKGRAKLALAVGVDSQTIYLWVKNRRIPDAHKALLILKEIGFSDEEALTLAGECSSEGRETA